MRLSLLIAILTVAVACNCSSPGTAPGPVTSKASASSAAVSQGADQADDVLAGILAADPDPREPRLAVAMQRLLENEHVRPQKIDDEIAEKALKAFIDRLDPGKLLLLEEHVHALEGRATTLDDEFRAGDFRTARQCYALMNAQRKKIAVKVDAMLAKPLNLTDDESFETDPEKISWAKDEAELLERWRRLLERQVLERIDRMADLYKTLKEDKNKKAKKKTDKGSKADDETETAAKVDPPPATFEGREKRAREELQKSYSGRFSRLLKPEKLEAAELFINAFASAYDPHSMYLAPTAQENFDIEISGSLEGIGAVLSEDDHYILVREVVPGGAAWRQGKLEEGDLILSVAQVSEQAVDVVDMRINEVVKMIRGPKGTDVILTVKKPDDRVLGIRITRDVVVVEATYAHGAVLRLDAKHRPVGYISLPGFYGNTRTAPGQTPERNATADVRALLERFKKQNLVGVVLDLRRNGGGLLDHAIGITGLLVDQGPVVKVTNARGKQQVLGDSDAGVSFGGQVAILVDRFSASASEILAGALQDYGRALIVGTGPTHGKGTVQALIDLDRVVGPGNMPLGVAKLTVQQFFLVDGESTQWRGVQPDVVLPDSLAHLETGERYLDNAIPFSSVDPLIATPSNGGAWRVEELVQKSLARQSKHQAFAKIRARQVYLEEREKQSAVPLAYEAFRAQRQEVRNTLEKLDLQLDEGPGRFAVKNVNYRAPTKDKKARAVTDERTKRWSEQLSRDPWLEETIRLVGDMAESEQGKAATRP